MAGDKLEQTVAGRPTIMKPPPDDPSKAPIENILEITQLSVLGPVRSHPTTHIYRL